MDAHDATPHSPDAEVSVIGSILLDPTAMDAVVREVRPDDFFDPANRIIYGHVTRMATDGQVDTTLLFERLKAAGDWERVGGGAAIARIIQSVATPAHARHYARIVREKSRWRKLVSLAKSIIDESQHGSRSTTETAATYADEMQSLVDSERGDYETDAGGMIHATVDAYERRKSGVQDFTRTGIGRLDSFLGGGMMPGHLLVLGARTSIGKSAFALQLVRTAATSGKYVVLFSVEMNREEVGMRLATSQANLNGLAVTAGVLAPNDEDRFFQACNEIRAAKLDVVDSPHQTAAGIVSACRRRARQQQLGLVVVDYLQLIGADKQGERWEREVASLSKQMKAMAQELRVPVLVLVQLNKNAEDATRPRKSHIHGCDAVAHDANVVMLLHRPNRDRPIRAGEPEDITLILDKNRGGPCGDVPLWWFRESMRYEAPSQAQAANFDPDLAAFNSPVHGEAF